LQHVQIDMEKLAGSLPLHLSTLLMSAVRNEALFRYLLRGIRLLHSLCDLASRNSKFEQVNINNSCLHLSYSAHHVICIFVVWQRHAI